MLSERDKLILHMVLSYAHANVDELSDAFADYSEDDPDGEEGKVRVGDERIDPPTDEELASLSRRLTGISL